MQHDQISPPARSEVLDPAAPGDWAAMPMGTLLTMPRLEVEVAQTQALILRFNSLRTRLEALDKLASRQGIERVTSVEEAVPVFFDHRVLKSYPMSLIEKGQYDRLTRWLQRLTTRDLTTMSLEGVTSLDTWLDRLDEHGMIMGHSSGTTGKLSFVARSQAEWPAWRDGYFEFQKLTAGVDLRVERVPLLSANYRRGHHMGTKSQWLFTQEVPGGEDSRYVLYDYPLSSDLLSLMGRMRAAEAKGELETLRIDPKLLEARAHLVEANRNRDADLERWFRTVGSELRGQRVRVGGLTADLTKMALKGLANGVRCEFAAGSFLSTGGGMKGFKEAPEDWEDRLREFLGVDTIITQYGMSESMAYCPGCTNGDYHVPPYLIPVVLDDDFAPLPKHGVQTGRMAIFDLLAETYWGGFISGDRVTVHWDDQCGCGWSNPRIERTIVRFSELTGEQDDKITCAGTAQAYSDFMDYVATV